MTYAVNQTSVKVIASSTLENQECIEVEFLAPLHHLHPEERKNEKEEDFLVCLKNEVNFFEQAENGTSSCENVLGVSFVEKDDSVLTTSPGSCSTFESEDRVTDHDKIVEARDKASSSLPPSTDSSIVAEVEAVETINKSTTLSLREDIASANVREHLTCDLNETSSAGETENSVEVEDGTTLTIDKTIDAPPVPTSKVKMIGPFLSDQMTSPIACAELLNEKEAELTQNEHMDSEAEGRPKTKAVNERASREIAIPRSLHIDFPKQVGMQSHNDTSFVNAMFDYVNIASSPSQDESIIGDLDDSSSAGEIAEKDGSHMYHYFDKKDPNLDEQQQRIDETRNKQKMTKDMFNYILHAGSDDASLLDLHSSSSDEIDTMYYDC
ncbi:unnamed protein product [Cylindrotheca closterium]|uniref:Uncharacterized protein n=1 Tax=Cylindrotheca closterium TaxID=2856 RepID=A0AAD2G9T2_9STRA|nr:unnamed protein product [Cylindrotheca closterium]